MPWFEQVIKYAQLPAKYVPTLSPYLGKISYGLYIFHVVALFINMALRKAAEHGDGSSLLVFASDLVVALVLTILLAALSYKYLETPYLKLKDRFALIESRFQRLLRNVSWTGCDLRRASRSALMKWISVVLLFLIPGTLSAQTAAINMLTVYQLIDGFGAASALGGLLPTSLVNAEFNTSTGLGLKFMRLNIVPDYADCVATFGSCVPSSGATLATYELTNAQNAVAQGAVIWATEWSPPGSMKSNGSYSSGGSFVGNATNYAALASIEASFVTLMTGTYGIPIYAISPQNEPNVSTAYPSCTWTSGQFNAFLPYLSAALAAAGYPNTKIMIAEPGHWNYDYMSYTMKFPAGAGVGIIAAHAYTGGSPPNTPAYLPTEFGYSYFTSQHIWETEVSDTHRTYDPSMVSGLTYALDIHNWLTISQVNAWHYWELSGQNYRDNQGLTSQNNVLAKRAYVMGQWARFVTGMSEVAATANPQSGVYVTAFLNLSTGAGAIVAINTNSTAVSQAFTISGRPGATSYNVTPYLTDPYNSIVQQTALKVSSNSFTANLTASSVTTFVLPSVASGSANSILSSGTIGNGRLK